MRIIAGQWKGLRLASVGKGDAAAHLRPTTDRTRESLFNILSGGRFGDPIVRARVLDLFAGTGALGLEALSRGASHVSFVENGRRAQALLRDNIRLTGAADRARMIGQDATRLDPCPDEPFTLVFLDPPYGTGLGARALTAARQGGWIAPDALIVWEDRPHPVAPPGFAEIDSRRYGDTWLSFFSPAP